MKEIENKNIEENAPGFPRESIDIIAGYSNPLDRKETLIDFETVYLPSLRARKAWLLKKKWYYIGNFIKK